MEYSIFNYFLIRVIPVRNLKIESKYKLRIKKNFRVSDLKKKKIVFIK